MTIVRRILVVLTLMTSSVFAVLPGASAMQTLTGFDISAWQKLPDFAAAKANGAAFAFVEATLGTGYVNPVFLQQFRAVKAAGLVRGAYHYARPDRSSGAAQADFLHANYGKWYVDGATLPPTVDLEDTDGLPHCYGMTPTAMVAWIRDFSTELKSLTGHEPIIYTTTLWWRSCTAESTAFAADHPLWLARYARSIGETPRGWQASFWQSGTTGPLPGDQDSFYGSLAQLRAFTTTG
ncbi:GH25 family lysozyme [Amycolatopsis pigmentata]|uniref:GH25 family lysozyme n=1 Tax=Amycolatopsis pigmentata TaxID=450801 RepID=A0ABW5FPP7_9PSEU